MKDTSGGLRIQQAQFRALAAFAQFGSNLDKATQQQLDRGLRLQELLKQPQYLTLPLADQVVAIYAGTNGLLDTIPVDKVKQWQSEFVRFFKTQHGDFYDDIAKNKQLKLEKVDGSKRNLQLEAIIKSFIENWAPASN